MSEKHYPYIGGSFDRIVFDGDGSVWVPEAENAKLRELIRILAYCMSEDRDCDRCILNGADMPTPRISACDSLPDHMRELGIEVSE